jgi:DNA-binding response OmpR family regulator
MPYDAESPPTQENGVVKTIIVVEDDEDIGSFLVQAILQETNYQAMLLTDGFQCLKAVTSIKPNLFILDYHLPSMNGIELYDQLHTRKELEHVPAVVVSARLPRQDIDKRQIVGMNKPLELDDLLHTIERLLA